MKHYIKPEFELVVLHTADIIATSNLMLPVFDEGDPIIDPDDLG